MADVIHDLVVVLPGSLGSTLSKNGRLVWAPSAGSVLKAIATFGGSIRELTLPDNIGDNHPNDGVEPVALMPDLHILPGIWSANIGYEKLLTWLRTRFSFIESSPTDPTRIPNLLPVPYDWRLSNRYNGRRLKGIVEPALARWQAQGGPFSDAKIIFVCHSMGGLVARWYIEQEGGAEHTRKLVTLATPYRGALKALEQLVNGAYQDIGPFKFDLTSFVRSLPSAHQLLPEYACIESPNGLLNLTETSVPQLNPTMVADAMRFHDQMNQAPLINTQYPYDIHPIVGTRQQTYTTAKIAGYLIEPIETISGNEALIKEWNIPDHDPKDLRSGNSRDIFPNPLHKPIPPEKMDAHLLQAARGGEPGEDGFYFTGRVAQINRIVSWMNAQKPGAFVVTGATGSGKSALLGRIVSLSNPEERARIRSQGPLEHADPGQDSVHAHVYARRFTAERLVGAIDAQLVRQNVLQSTANGTRTLEELERAIQKCGTYPVIALDGLDESEADSWRIAENVLRTLSEVSLVLVGTQDLPPQDGPLSLIKALGGKEILDLDEITIHAEAEQDLRNYVLKRLSGVSAAMDACKVADTVLQHFREQPKGTFLPCSLHYHSAPKRSPRYIIGGLANCAHS